MSSMSIIPDPKDPATTLYVGQMLFVTVKVTMDAPGMIPENSYVQLASLGPDSPSALVANDFDKNTDYNKPQLIIPDDSTRQTGTATFILNVTADTPTNAATNLTFTALATPASLNIAPVNVSYTVLGAQLNPVISDASQFWVPIPPQTSNAPPPTDTQYTISFTASVTDPDNDDEPVSNYVIDWHEDDLGPFFKDLFTAQMYAYRHISDTVPLDPNALGKDGLAEESPGKFFVRTVTDAGGVASLYLVARNGPGNVHGGKAAGSLVIWPWHTGSVQKGEFVVIDLNSTDVIPYAPSLPPADIVDGKLDYEKIPSTYVPVKIDLSNGGTGGDPVFTFINYTLGDIFSWFASDQSPYNSSFPKVLGYSDTSGDHQGALNTLQFVWVKQGDGSINLSSSLTFHGTGDKGNVPPPPPPTSLTPPLLTAGGVINHYLAESPISITVPLIQLSWSAHKDDEITVTANINGYDGRQTPRPPVTVFSSPYTVSEHDITVIGNALITLNQKMFQNWSYGPDTSTDQSWAYISYEVFRPSSGESWQSAYLKVQVDTVNI